MKAAARGTGPLAGLGFRGIMAGQPGRRASGQRRYVESLSAYARQFLEQMEKPDIGGAV